MSNWSPATHPYVARWSHPTGDRLTRYTTTTVAFATEAEAIAAIERPFPANTSDAHVVRFSTVVGAPAPMIAKRKRCKKLVRLLRGGV